MQQSPGKIKLAIADDHSLFRKGLIELLRQQEQYELLFDADNGKTLIDRILGNKELIPDIIIMDIKMPGMNGYETVAWLRENYPDIRVLVVSSISTDDDIIKMLKLGVKGYLTKEMEPEDLHEALNSIAQKNYYYTDFVTNRLIHSILNEAENNNTILHHKVWDSLNIRQKEFIRHACTEMNYEEIAREMNVSPKTIDGYRDVVFERFNVKSRVALVLYAIKNKLVTV